MHAIHHTLSAARSIAHKAVHDASRQTQPYAPAGSFALRAGRALSLRPQAASVLRITQGAAWVTLPSLPGDHILQAGDSLPIRAGDAVVLEAWHVPAAQALYFDWDAASVQVLATDGVAASGSWLREVDTVGAQGNRHWVSLGRWGAISPSYCEAVLQPLADLRGALVLGGLAAARLLLGLARWSIGKLLDAAIFLATSRARASTV